MLKLDKKSKPKVAIIGLTSCEGCQFVVLDQGQKFLELSKKINLGDFRLIKDAEKADEKYDICFVEGNPITKENIKLLKEMREKSKLLVVLGNCAALGGVWEIKNYHNKQKTIRAVYKKSKVANPDIKEVDNFVKVDFTIPGCPINGDEFMEAVHQLLNGKIPRPTQNPVCYECQLNGSECLLQKGEICLGPITLAGCNAVCLKSKQACWGCRGLFEGAQVQNLMKHLNDNLTKDEIYHVMEVFGARDSIMAELNKEEGKK
jgi:coenzyme F420-reducing hydrogenase gamma subunit